MVRSTYSFLSLDTAPKHSLGSFFDRIWRVVVPKRVRVFLWSGVNHLIMTNVERHIRHLGD